MLSLLMLIIEYLFFFFKQKTAYEMRISDWSSDVCSSDLTDRTDGADRAKTHAHSADRHARRQVLLGRRRSGTVPWPEVWRLRSEEHTSELQSLMRKSYAVFCLKKKKNKNTIHRIKLTNIINNRNTYNTS